ncbi:MAG: hypothetical protein ACRDUY_05975 [Nitriliruptorales bacterium]
MSENLGRRRLDRILEPGYLADLGARPTEEIRAMRDECEEEESGVSFARRVTQGKLDIVRAEALRRREVAPDQDTLTRLLDALPEILGDDPPGTPLRARVTRLLVSPAVQHHRRDVERVASESTLASLSERSTEELAHLVELLDAKEHELSALRHQLFDRLDALQAELARRYKEGVADVSEILPKLA